MAKIRLRDWRFLPFSLYIPIPFIRIMVETDFRWPQFWLLTIGLSVILILFIAKPVTDKVVLVAAFTGMLVGTLSLLTNMLLFEIPGLAIFLVSLAAFILKKDSISEPTSE